MPLCPYFAHCGHNGLCPFQPTSFSCTSQNSLMVPLCLESLFLLPSTPVPFELMDILDVNVSSPGKLSLRPDDLPSSQHVPPNACLVVRINPAAWSPPYSSTNFTRVGTCLSRFSLSPQLFPYKPQNPHAQNACETLCLVLVVSGLAGPRMCECVSSKTHQTLCKLQWSLEEEVLRTCPNTREIDLGTKSISAQLRG